MLLRSLLILGTSSLFLLSCGPKAPKLTFCVVDSYNGRTPSCLCRDADKNSFELTIEECDGFIAQPLADAQLLQQYVNDLERRVARCK
jgi:hypothetical protein